MIYEVVTTNKLYIVGKFKHVIDQLKTYEEEFATLKELTENKLDFLKENEPN